MCFFVLTKTFSIFSTIELFSQSFFYDLFLTPLSFLLSLDRSAVLFQCEKHPPLLIKALAQELSVDPERIGDFELCLADHAPAVSHQTHFCSIEIGSLVQLPALQEYLLSSYPSFSVCDTLVKN